MNTAAPSPVLALLDDAGAGAVLLEMSSALARTMQRELSVVFVESAPSLRAATLPFAQVLPASGSQWRPLQPGDVEQGFRAHAARLRDLAARYAMRDAVAWSLRVVRGSLGEAALQLQAESDLLLLAGAPPLQSRGAAAAPAARRRPVVITLGDGDEASRHALQVATQLARALSGVLEVAHLDPSARLLDQPERLRALARCDVLVLPRAPLDPGTLALLRCPLLLVG